MKVVIPTGEDPGYACVGVKSFFDDVRTLHQLRKKEKKVIEKLITSDKFPGVVLILMLESPRYLNSQSSVCLMAEVLLRSFGSYSSLGMEIERNGLDADFGIHEVRLCERLGAHYIEIYRRGAGEISVKKTVEDVCRQIGDLLEERFATDAIFQKFYGKK